MQTENNPVRKETLPEAYKRRLTHMAYEYVAGGAGDEITLRENQSAFDRLRLLPRVLVDVSKLDTRVTLFGQPFDVPILLAPTAYHRIVHPEGEIATVRGVPLQGERLQLLNPVEVGEDHQSTMRSKPGTV